MKTLVIYYSYSGNTKKFAEILAKNEGADITEIKDAKRPGKLKAYTAGCFAAMRSKVWPILPIEDNMADYERLILLAPIWANNPAPAFNALLQQLPPGKAVSLKMISASGKSGCKERLEAAVKAKDCTVESFEDIKA